MTILETGSNNLFLESLNCRDQTLSHKTVFMKEKADQHFERASKSDIYKRILVPLGKSFNRSEEDIYTAFTYYNLQINSYTNEFYSSLDCRFALAINYLVPETWFSRRLNTYMATCIGHHTICDIGFGVPLVFIHHALTGSRPKRGMAFHYFDKYDSATIFGGHFVSLMRDEFAALFSCSPAVDFRILDLDAPQQGRKSPISSDLVIACDCLEHAHSPAAALRFLSMHFPAKEYLIALPVGPIIPQHTIQFTNEPEVTDFVKQAVFRIIDQTLVTASWNSDLVGNEDFLGSSYVRCRVDGLGATPQRNRDL